MTWAVELDAQRIESRLGVKDRDIDRKRVVDRHENCLVAGLSENRPHVLNQRIRIALPPGQAAGRVPTIEGGELRGGRLEFPVMDVLGEAEVGLEKVARLGRAAAVAKEIRDFG